MSWFCVLHRSLLAVAFVFICGCGGKDPYERHAISGIVSLDGEPLATGNITFFPETSGSVATGGTIQDGEFTVPKDQGLPAGKYKVSITATTTKGPVPTDPNELMANPPEVVSLIPKIYNSETTLTAEVSESPENSFTFDLLSK